MTSRGFEKPADGLYSRPPLKPETANAEVSASGAASSRAAVTEQPTAAAEDEEENLPPPARETHLNLGDWSLPAHGMLQLKDGSVQVVKFQFKHF